MYKIAACLGMVVFTSFLVLPVALAYEDGASGKAVVEGTITFKGTPPPPKMFDLAKFPQPAFCGKVDNDGKGHRILREVTVNDGRLQDVVVYIQDIAKGKPFLFNGTDVKMDHCRFLVQGGASSFVGVVVDGGEIRFLNTDADPKDPRAATGVLHNPHTHSVRDTTGGKKSYTMFNKPLPNKGQVLMEKITLKTPDSVVNLACDQHEYEQAWFYPIQNPYYAIVGSGGTYSIDQVPAGKYKLIAWHPILGVQEKTIEVGATGTVTANFEFSK